MTNLTLLMIKLIFSFLVNKNDYCLIGFEECECWAKGIACSIRTDIFTPFPSFDKYINKYGSYGETLLKELTITYRKYRTIPRNSFKGMKISRIVLTQNQIEEIEENSFYSVMQRISRRIIYG